MNDDVQSTIAYLNRLLLKRFEPAEVTAAAEPPAPPARRPDNEKPRVATKGKSTCKVCKRDVKIVPIERPDGTFEMVEFDPEVITGVEYPKGKRRQFFQRTHADRCSVYEMENEKKAKHERWRRQAGG